ncbi:MAG: Gmad2 immunoglobulin-like domain-containing protein [Ferruginibacter sp.]
MRSIYFLAIILCSACNNDQQKVTPVEKDTATTSPPKQPELIAPAIPGETYSNKAFKDVTVESIAKDSFRVKGKGRIFEANFSWVVEDGHDELKKGYQMTDAGAPEWGNFDFKFAVRKKRENSTLTLILFESSAEDGRRLHELPVALK